MQKRLVRIIAAILVLSISFLALVALISSFPTVDRDGDGLSDGVEEDLGTDPMNPDSDYDGLKDGWEYRYWENRSINEHRSELAPDGDVDGDNLTNILDYDSDNDGFSDGEEIANGTDPADPANSGTIPGNGNCNGNGGNGICPGNGENGDGGCNCDSGGDASCTNPPTKPGDLGYNSSDPSQRSRIPSRNGNGSNVTCFAVFDPALLHLKRYSAYDAIHEDYTASIADPTLYPLELSATQHEYVFRGTLLLTGVTDRPIAIPSVAPDANIITYTTAPEISLEFFKDGADNFYVKPQQKQAGIAAMLTFTTSADASYFMFYIPDDLTLDDIPETVKHTPPAAVYSKARLIIDELGLTGEKNLKTIVSTLKAYFSNFTEGDIPSEEEEPDSYLATARAKHGACYVRSFAFFITANAIGMPCRLITNECHAFVELYIPSREWIRLDLGGLGECNCCNPNNSDIFDIPQYTTRIPTTTTITTVSASVYKEGSFTVEGYVEDDNQTGVGDMPVHIFVNKTKTIPGDYAGQGATDDTGHFLIDCRVPTDASAGTNHIVAYATGSSIYKESWSDPTIEIYSNTTLQLTIAESVGIDEELDITGYLYDASNKSLVDKPITVSWNGSLIGTPRTDENGTFSLIFIPKSLGTYNVSATFAGETYLSPSKDSLVITVKDMSVQLNVTVTPTLTKRGDQVRIQGILCSGTEGALADTTVYLYYNETLVITTVTKSDGLFEENLTIPADSPLGNISVRAHYAGDHRCAEANAEQTIFVQSETHLVLTSPSKKNFKRNETLTIRGILTDNIDQPIDNVTVYLNWSLHETAVLTDLNGTFDISYVVPANAAYETLMITAEFTGNHYYLPSHDQHQIEIIQPREHEDESQITYMLLAIAMGGVAVGVLVGMIMLFKEGKNEEDPTIEDIASQTIDKLRTDDDHRKTVINCYKQMCDWLGKRGVKRDAYRTPREFALAAKRFLQISPNSLYELTQVFEKARYSKHEIDSNDRNKAIASLNEILAAPLDVQSDASSSEGSND